MKIAVFSDVHANLAALDAVLAEIKKKAPDVTICAGDLVGYGPFPDQVIQLIQEENIPCVMGNYDDGVGFSRIICGCDYRNDDERVLGEQSILWTKEHTKEESKEFLRSLPHEIRLEADGKRILVVHGSPNRLNEYLNEDTPEDLFKSFLEGEGVDLLICGHTHVPYHKILDQGHVINVGSIGKPKHGKNSAVYALIQVDHMVSVEFIDVPYDVEMTAQAIEKSQLPKEYAQILRSGGNVQK